MELGIPVLTSSSPRTSTSRERCVLYERESSRKRDTAAALLPVEKMCLGGSHLPSKNHPPFGVLERKKE
jgi:hypothetical protein